MENLKVIENWMQRVWWDQDEEAIDEMFRPGSTATGLGGKMSGPEEFKVFHQKTTGSG